MEEFLAQFPEHANDDENELMFARIDHERAEREGLEQQRQELLKRKQKLIADNKRRKEDLANLDNDLEKFIDVRPASSLPHHRHQSYFDQVANTSNRRRNRSKSSSRRRLDGHRTHKMPRTRFPMNDYLSGGMPIARRAGDHHCKKQIGQSASAARLVRYHGHLYNT